MKDSLFQRAKNAWVLLGSCLALSAGPGQSEVDPSGGRVLDFQLTSSNQVRLHITRTTQQAYTILTGTNLQQWTPVVPGAPEFEDSQSVTHSFDLVPEWPQAFFKVLYRDVVPNPDPLPALDGPPTGAVKDYLPPMGAPRVDEAEVQFVKGVLPISLSHVLATVPDSTTVQALNELLVAEELSVAGAVPAMKLLVLRRNDVTTLQDLDALMERLRATGLFSTVADDFGMSGPDPILGEAPPAELAQSQVLQLRWTWDVSGLGYGTGGNSFLELSRIPQLWNWLDYGHRQKASLGGHEVAVLEFAFYDHNELGDSVVLDYSESTRLDADDYNHGTAVLGVITARHDTRGIQGVTPLPDRVVGHAFPLNNTGQNAYSGVYLAQLAAIMTNAATPPKVVNISSGMKWITRNIGHPTNTFRASGVLWSTWMDNHGKLWADCFAGVNQRLADPHYLVVCAAGNEKGVDARYASPMANIACRPQDFAARVPQFLTVESVDGMRQPSLFTDYDLSGTGDSVSAGGDDITVLRGPEFNMYHLHSSGTSYSSPLVAGLASFLWSLDPTLTVTEMKMLLHTNTTTFQVREGTRGNLVDGYAAALEIDRLRGNHKLHTALVDVDDGTHDGNLREQAAPWELDPDKIHNPDGRRGDGLVNMKDFRAFRDAWLYVVGITNHLDGPSNHYKRDANFDGLIVDQAVFPPHPPPYEIGSREDAAPLAEKFYSRFDFNGNGRLDAETDHYNPPTNAVSPFKIDPDTPVTRRNVPQGLVRDVDVLVDPAVWTLDEEKVAIDGEEPDLNFYSSLPPEGWTTNILYDFTFYSNRMPFLWSFDLHVDMEGGDPVNGDKIPENLVSDLVGDGLWIDSFFRTSKARLGAWQGVVTIPIVDPTDFVYQTLPTNFPWVTIFYKKTVGDEFHQYYIPMRPEVGEDIAFTVGFDQLEIRSTTREQITGMNDYADLPAREIIGRDPAGAAYGEFFVSFENYSNHAEDIELPARDLAVSALAGRLRTPRALNGSPNLVPIYEESYSEIGIEVRIYGLIAIFDP